MARRNIVGALIGWKRTESTHGIVISLQLATSEGEFRKRDFDRVAVSLNDRQLRSLARDLQRAAQDRGIQLWAKPKWFRILSWLHGARRY